MPRERPSLSLRGPIVANGGVVAQVTGNCPALHSPSVFLILAFLSVISEFSLVKISHVHISITCSTTRRRNECRVNRPAMSAGLNPYRVFVTIAFLFKDST